MLIAQITDIHLGFDRGNPEEMNQQRLDRVLTTLAELKPQPDLVFATGDLVEHGDVESYERLRKALSALPCPVHYAMGNHDLRALGVAAGCLRPDARDTLNDLFDAPDADVLLDWLRARPLIHVQDRHVLVHAGLYPGWDVLQAMAHAGEVEAMLRDNDWRRHMRTLLGAAPLAWNARLETQLRLRFIVSAFTRMRLCTRNGALAPGAKSTPGRWPRETLPWYNLPRRAGADKTIVFGHWATLGLLVRSDAVCLDTGCVTGGPLTAYRLSDRKLVQVAREALAQVA